MFAHTHLFTAAFHRRFYDELLQVSNGVFKNWFFCTASKNLSWKGFMFGKHIRSFPNITRAVHKLERALCVLNGETEESISVCKTNPHKFFFVTTL